MSQARRVAACVAGSLLILGILPAPDSPARAERGSGAGFAPGGTSLPTIQAAGRGNPWINLQDGFPLAPSADATGTLGRPRTRGSVRPLALAAADLDEDGVPDLIAGYASDGGGILRVHRGPSPEAPSEEPLRSATGEITPSSRLPQAASHSRESSTLGIGSAGSSAPVPLLPLSASFDVETAPEFLVAGDFDADGHADVVMASRSDEGLLWLPGDGHGELGAAERIDLPGPVTALAAGEINRGDGLTDLIVGVGGSSSPRLLVFESREGAFGAEPEVIDLPESATSLSLGQMDTHYAFDLAVAAGSHVVLVHGRDRHLPDVAGGPVADPVFVEDFALPFRAISAQVGRFLDAGRQPRDLALLADDGAVHVMRIGPAPLPGDASAVSAPGATAGFAGSDESLRFLGEALPGGRGASKGRSLLEEVYRSEVLLSPEPLASPRPELAPGESVTPHGAGRPAAVGSLGAGERPGADPTASLGADPTASFGSRASTQGSDVSWQAASSGASMDPASLLSVRGGSRPTLPPAHLVRVRLTGSDAEDLVLVDPGQRSLKVLPGRVMAMSEGEDGERGGKSSHRDGIVQVSGCGRDGESIAGIVQASGGARDGGAIAGNAQGSSGVRDGGAIAGNAQGSGSARGGEAIAGNAQGRGGVRDGEAIAGFVSGGDGARADGVSADMNEGAVSLSVARSPVAVLPMLLNEDGLSDLIVLLDGLEGPSASLTAPLATFTVNNVGDASDATPGDGVCLAVGGGCTLRAAIEEANALAGADTINFAGSGTQTIVLGSPLPSISSSVFLNSTSGGSLKIELNGAGAGAGANGLVFVSGSSGTRVQYFVINRFAGAGIRIESSSNIIEGCFIGTDSANGASVPGNGGGGVLITGAAATNNTLGAQSNYICHNEGFGLSLENGASTNTATQASIGACPQGTSNPNNGDGVLITTGANNNIITTTNISNTGYGVEITGGAATAGNRTPASSSGNALDGVRVHNGAQSNTINGSIFTNGNGNPANDGVEISGVGTNLNIVTATIGSPLGNPGAGVRITGGAQSNTVMGSSIVRNGASGVEISGSGTNFNKVQGSTLGGSSGNGNLAAGVRVSAGAQGNAIGGAATGSPGTGQGNWISSNGTLGVRIEGVGTTGTTVQGSLIGTDQAGTAALGNVADGVSIAGVGGTLVGGAAANLRNIISGNGGEGVAIEDNGASANTVQGNFIGTNVAGTAAVGNAGSGVRILATGSATGNTVGGQTSVPGTAPGNVISGNSGPGVLITGPGATDNTVSGNLIGTNAAGALPVGNRQDGVQITNAVNNVVGGAAALDRNVISGNGSTVFIHGVDISGANATGNRVQGNFIGTNRAGTLAVLNGGNGVIVQAGADSNLIGGSAASPGQAPGNLISGNQFDFSSDGIEISGIGTNGNLVQGNLIGTDVNGLAPLANGGNGVLVADGASGSVIGGSSAGLRNVISGNNLTAASDGVEINQASGTTVSGNFIGTTRPGSAALPNRGNGIFVFDGNGLGAALGNVVGGTTSGARNVISANALHGVRVSGPLTSGTMVSGNSIGTDAAGSGALGNGLDGVYVSLGSSGNTIGGTTGLTTGACTGSCNVIASNGDAGVRIFGAATDGNGIRANAIASNGGLGIDLDPSAGVSLNDAGDTDSGANELQNFPVITNADFDGTNTTIMGTIASAANTTYVIDVFGNAAADPSSYGEGRDYLGSTSSPTNGAGDGTWALVAPGNHTLLTATATDPAANSSEFSASFVNPGEALQVLAARGAGTTLDVTYAPACGATDHSVYVGTTPIAGSLVWSTCFCGLGSSGVASFDPGTPPVGRSFYFAIVGYHATAEGSYGVSSASLERPEAGSMGVCDRPRATSVLCP